MKKLLNIAKYFGYGIYAVCALLMILFLVPVTGWKALTVATGSMKPAIPPGSLVLVHHVAPTDLNVGDVATYINPANQSQTITHRIQSVVGGVTPRTFIFKGDANPRPDSTPVVAGRVVGKVTWHVAGVGYAVEQLRKPLGLAIIIIIPGLLVIAAELRKLGKLLYGPRAHTETTEPPTPNDPPANGPPTADATIPKMPAKPAPKHRSIDGMGRLTLLGFLFIAIITIAPTYSLLQAHASLTNNTITTGTATPAPSPTPTLSPSPTPSDTDNNTLINVTNINHQTASSGDVTTNGNTTTGSASSGSASNQTSNDLQIIVSNY